ncbi:hypothetical protein LOK49_LG09G01765 [Camellia lanceoleosa]|uniref:Uncharacterized protein n=1 Tax=Camellia lanceoleosa TaxID=1840588 RepID=A0ACC0GKM0_9ERIC|nr:hypothetical protein LOK49_LG09G01765 [Camellia lanceoleosa]
MSECYLLDRMPKGLASLYRLQMLSGLMVGDLEDTDMCALNKFKALTKLTIAWGRGSVQVKRYDGKNKHNTAAEQGTEAIKKVGLKSTLIRTFAFKRACVSNTELPSGLIKLDLQCFPRKIIPRWLRSFALKNLKRLYIRGGKFSNLGQFLELDNMELEKDKWEVEELRLKYLTDLEMDWSKLQV